MTRLIGIMGGEQIVDGNTSQRMNVMYPRVVGRMMGANAVMIPGMPEAVDIGGLIERLDGIVLTGGRPNVHPEEWGGEPHEAHEPYDRGRDRVAIDLVRAAVGAGLPVFGICRGIQEMAVAFGSKLHPEIRELPGRMNHRRPKGDIPREEVFKLRHKVRLEPGGTFARLYGAEEIETNSLHGQGVEELGPRVRIEGRAEDGTVEAIEIADASGFALGVQWHAEYDPWDQPVNAVLWRAFAAAVEGRDWRTAGRDVNIETGAAE